MTATPRNPILVSGDEDTEQPHLSQCVPENELSIKRIEYSIRDAAGGVLQGPAFVHDCSDLPPALMLAMEDFLDAHDLRLRLPLIINIHPSTDGPTC